ncbi:MAG: glutathione S-transferase [Pseudomonadota bacterium]
MADGLRLEDCVNDVCPWSGDPVSADSLTTYRGRVVGFCNPRCRDKFERAVVAFDDVLQASEPTDGR